MNLNYVYKTAFDVSGKTSIFTGDDPVLLHLMTNQLVILHMQYESSHLSINIQRQHSRIDNLGSSEGICY